MVVIIPITGRFVLFFVEDLAINEFHPFAMRTFHH